MEFEPYSQQHFGMNGYPGPGMHNMSSMVAALPDYQTRYYQQQPFPQHFQSPGTTNQSLMYQYQQSTQFAGQAAPNYSHPYSPQFPNQYVQSHPQRQHQQQQQHAIYPQFVGGPTGPNNARHLQNQSFMLQQPLIHNSNGPMQQHQLQATQFTRQANAVYADSYDSRMVGGYPLPQLRLDIRRSSSNSSLQKSVLRGPPRKPKQSGHALWVGNLPPATHIIDLKDHFSRDATDSIESVFLISKSNCAFVNYKTETSCATAMSRFHDSRFQGVRLVCRLRRGSISTSAPQTVAKNAHESAGESDTSPTAEDGALTDGEAKVGSDTEAEVVEKVKEKFFVVKSLTVDDLERSVHSGVWATQAHNETALNKAFQAAENVYLIFSANKSGEYFGYARMESTIDGDTVADLEYQPSPEAPPPTAADLPLTILTPATSTAPRGRIIDDSARGTIFWEAGSENKIQEDQAAEDEAVDLSAEGEDFSNPSPGTPQTFGNPFKIKWISTDRLPFYRTRGLRNPWNANREVKIARDGTEIEPNIGRRLVSLFHRPQMPAASSNAPRQPPPSQGGMSPFMNPHAAAPGGMYGRSY
ncbi:uncharacterized protein A1O9_00100 [Exophiala aquamarina CBS 119918]|uniref:YTH domain-containing protein n=1 Tax=Exophiala aquamarina CBS 119918 TaxID=1182545 RepID=A0A072PS10_9EURO|nr:uncharacterized protein A1O9_00100 [Exophiala aquamarina CBS 119918]KEF62128.1 hypothetical protein A1O9_00100 [Exophiala aquamarina CBS 119918]